MAIHAQFTYITTNGAIITGYTGPRGQRAKVIIPSEINGLPVTTIGDSAFYGWDLGSVTIPDSVVTLENSAFASCGLTNATIGNGVTSIGDLAFDSCPLLTSVTIPDGVITLGRFAFASCGLTNATIGNGVTSIGDYGFYGCSSLPGVTIPVGVASTGDAPFANCRNFQLFNFQPATPRMLTARGPDRSGAHCWWPGHRQTGNGRAKLRRRIQAASSC
jgi:hypothetical protein